MSAAQQGPFQVPRRQPADPGDPPDDPRIALAVKEFLAKLEAGENPDRAETIGRYPDLAVPIGRCLDGLELVHRAATGVPPPLAAPDETPDPIRQQAVGDFRILHEIGRGGMGVVYEAEQLSLGRRVALKVLPFAAAFDSRQLQRFRNEARAAAMLHHSNIVPVHAVGSDRGIHYYAMQLIEGQSLAQLIDRLRREPPVVARSETPSSSEGSHDGSSRVFHDLSTALSADERAYFRAAAGFIIQAAQGLEHAHQAGIVHRDIKPANLLLDASGRLWITDFGLAYFHSDAALTHSGDLLGTLRYMSPEQAGGERSAVDHRTDIYSLGATLYELVTLRPLFSGSNRQQILDQIMNRMPRSPRSVVRSIPVELETIILKSVSKSPIDRYESAAAFGADLQRYLDHVPIVATRPTIAHRARMWTRRHPSVLASALFVMAAAIAGLAVSNHLISIERSRTAQRALDAERGYQRAREAIDLMVRGSEDELADHVLALSMRRRFLETALDFYQGLIDQEQGDMGLQAELAAGQARVRRLLDSISGLNSARLLNTLANGTVQRDLGLTAEQRERVSRIDRAKVDSRSFDDTLTGEQRARLQQIALQLEGSAAFYESLVVEKLQLTTAQKEQIRKIDRETSITSLLGRSPGRSFGMPGAGDSRPPNPFAAFAGNPANGDDFAKAMAGANAEFMKRLQEVNQPQSNGGPESAPHAVPGALSPDDFRKAMAGDPAASFRLTERFTNGFTDIAQSGVARILEVLTPEQKDIWQRLVGPPFKGPTGLSRLMLSPEAYGWPAPR